MRFTPKWHPDHPSGKWHRWFAWHPIFVKRLNCFVWLEPVYRRRRQAAERLPGGGHKLRVTAQGYSRNDLFDYEKDMVGVIAHDAEAKEEAERQKRVEERVLGGGQLAQSLLRPKYSQITVEFERARNLLLGDGK